MLAGTGYIVYRLRAVKGEAITDVTISLTAKVSHLSRPEYAANSMNIYYGENLGVLTLLKMERGNGNDVRDFCYTLNFFEMLDLYVKIELKNYEAELPLAYVGINLYATSIVYQGVDKISFIYNFK